MGNIMTKFLKLITPIISILFVTAAQAMGTTDEFAISLRATNAPEAYQCEVNQQIEKEDAAATTAGAWDAKEDFALALKVEADLRMPKLELADLPGDAFHSMCEQGYLTRKDIKVLRLTCKKLKAVIDATNPGAIFNTVRFSILGKMDGFPHPAPQFVRSIRVGDIHYKLKEISLPELQKYFPQLETINLSPCCSQMYYFYDEMERFRREAENQRREADHWRREAQRRHR